jgi:hypothetical protein
MEGLTPGINVSSCGYEEEIKKLNNEIDGFGLAKNLREYYRTIHQLCLCRNAESHLKYPGTGVFEPIEHYGFAKPRMWDQYGGRYSGVCIALSKNRLINQLPPDFKILDIEYSANNLFKTNLDNLSIDLNRIEKIGEKDYMGYRYNKEIERLKRKHNDYRDENETKIIAVSNDNFIGINFETCIQGLFVTNKCTYTNEKWITSKAKNLNIPLIELQISRSGLKIIPLA